jgi:NTE family protein
VAIALGSGGARGIGHVLALEALDEMGISPVAIAGTSIGAIMGGAYAARIEGTLFGLIIASLKQSLR